MVWNQKPTKREVGIGLGGIALGIAGDEAVRRTGAGAFGDL